GKVDRGSDQHKSRNGGARLAIQREFARQQKRKPSPHGGADNNLRPAAERVEHRKALLKPAAHCSRREVTAGLAVARIVEPPHRTSMLARPPVERLRLYSLHVRFEAAEPKQPRGGAFAQANRDAPGLFPSSNLKKFQANIAHSAGPSHFFRAYNVSSSMQAR